MQRSKGYALMFLLGAFLAGGALGFTADRVITRDKPCKDDRRPSLDAMATELNLTDAQRVAFDSILENRRQQMDGLFAPLRPQMDSLNRLGQVISDSTHEQLKRILSPAQQVKLDERRARMRERREKRDAERREANLRAQQTRERQGQ